MLCLKAEVLGDDHHDGSASPDITVGSCGGGAGGFVLPFNFGSSIHRYLRKAGAGKGSRHWNWSGSFSSPDGSPTSSHVEDTMPRDIKYGQEKGETMCLYKHQLKEDVKQLQIQLQEEIDLQLALASAVEHYVAPFSNSPSQLPEKVQELLDSISVLEITISKLEQQLVALQYQLSQERNERRLAEYRLRHLPCSASPLFNFSPVHLTESSIRPWSGGDAETKTDEMPMWPDVYQEPNKDYHVKNLWHNPNQLSEEMVLCMRDIFLFLANSSKLASSECVASPSSPQCHLSHSSSASLSDLPLPGTSSLARNPSVDMGHGYEDVKHDSLFDPYKVHGKVDWTESIGPYCRAVDVSWLSVGKKELEFAAGALKRFRLLVEQLTKVNPSRMSCNEKLAFWINLYNALIMHAYLAYGVPRSDIKLFSLMQKVTYTVGGHSFSAVDIEYIILKMKPPAHRPQIALVLALHKFKVSEEQKLCSIDHPEPLLAFALSCGMHSSPAVRIFTPGNVNELLKKSLKDYVRASVGISIKGKLLVPKLLHCFAKGVVEDSLLPEWICQYLSPEQAAMVRDTASNHKWRLLGARSFSILPFDSMFRYLFLMNDEP